MSWKGSKGFSATISKIISATEEKKNAFINDRVSVSWNVADD